MYVKRVCKIYNASNIQGVEDAQDVAQMGKRLLVAKKLNQDPNVHPMTFPESMGCPLEHPQRH